MKRAALGVRMHSGWGALVAVAHEGGKVDVLERRRIAVTAPGASRAVQPYHHARDLALASAPDGGWGRLHTRVKVEFAEAGEAAEKFLVACFEESTRLAQEEIRKVVEELEGRRYRVAGAAVLLAAGRRLPPLPRILAAHPLIHTAEGQFFRDVVGKACQALEIPLTGIRERSLQESVDDTFGKSAAKVRRQVADMVRRIGSPWTQDQKAATLGALLVLNSPAERPTLR
jgi:hypothetical protein